MKARNKKTGEIVSNFNVSKEWGTAYYIDSTNTLRFSTPTDGEWEIIDESDPVDRDTFRREAAKDILCSLLSRVERIYTCVKSDGARVTDHRDFIRIAIEDADELIEQLKEEKK